MPHHSPHESSEAQLGEMTSRSREKTDRAHYSQHQSAASTKHSLRKEGRNGRIFRVYYAPGLLLGAFAQLPLNPNNPILQMKRLRIEQVKQPAQADTGPGSRASGGTQPLLILKSHVLVSLPFHLP